MDFDDDGDMDIIVGDRDGYVNYFSRTGSGVHDLTSMGHVQASGTDIDVGTNSAPMIVDWNEDGLHDLVLGRESTSGGSLRLYLNSGTLDYPLFTTYTTINVGASPIAYSRTIPHVVDLNLDGKKDLVLGEDYGHVYYLENTGTNASPVFPASVMLQANGTPIAYPSGYTDTKVWIDDWNEDGWPDIILGNYVTNVHLYLSYPTSTGETTEPLSERHFEVYGSPAYGSIGFAVSLDAAAVVKVLIYSFDGRLAKTIDFGNYAAGEHLLHASTEGLPSGAYRVIALLGEIMVTDGVVVLR